ncbi:MAG TPA: AAA family ATPase [Bryobacteraceae bacterium]|jgi:type II secretory pathway predicted ATPase ExeA|nr:AAA family ATPase [Bryobacteraceae bacterium]
MTVKQAMDSRKVSTRRLGMMVGISKTAIHRLVDRGEWPARVAVAELKRKIIHALSYDSKIHIDFPALREGPQPQTEPLQEIDLMQLDRSVMQLFGLRSNPFINDVETDDDVMHFRGYDAVEQAIKDTIEQRGFLAVIAESGSGKTTIWDGIEAVYGNREDTVICKPNVKSREKLTPEHLARTLIYGLSGEDISIKANAEDRGRQLSTALRNIRTAQNDRKAVLYIDDAHFCSQSVLRQLKTFFEEKIGRFRLLAIILIGLPTLKTKLSEFPEIGNRIRTVEVPPVPVDEYLQFKLQRAGSSIEKLFDPAGLAAFLERFRQGRRPPLGRPLVINAMCIRAMVRLYANGATAGERITREIVDSLPGEAPARRAA